MADYAIGDVQGCFAELQCLLERIAFDPDRDRLWFTGDLVNRGPQSLETLRFIKRLGEAAVSVLGNHDLHLLAVACGVSRTKRKDTFEAVLAAPDRDELLEWLRRLPLMRAADGFYLIHAGLPPQWDLNKALSLAHEVEAVLQGEHWRDFLARMYGNEPDTWSEHLSGWDRLRFITNCFTRMRYCDAHGALNFHEKGRPGSQAAGLMPWFQVPGRASAGARVLFGHWSTLGFYEQDACIGLDTGCLWGGELTALRLEPDSTRRISVSCRGHARPGA